MFNGKIHYKWQFSIAMLVYQRVPLHEPKASPFPPMDHIMEVSWSQPENQSHRVFCWAIRLFGLPNPAHHVPAEQLLFRSDGLNCAHENICDYGLKPHARAQGGW